jgi:hypothetical protein
MLRRERRSWSAPTPVSDGELGIAAILLGLVVTVVAALGPAIL